MATAATVYKGLPLDVNRLLKLFPSELTRVRKSVKVTVEYLSDVTCVALSKMILENLQSIRLFHMLPMLAHKPRASKELDVSSITLRVSLIKLLLKHRHCSRNFAISQVTPMVEHL